MIWSTVMFAPRQRGRLGLAPGAGHPPWGIGRCQPWLDGRGFLSETRERDALSGARPRQHRSQPLPRAVHREAREAAQVGARIAVAWRALDARRVGAVAVAFVVGEEHRGTVAADEAERGRSSGHRGVERTRVTTPECRTRGLERGEARDRPALDEPCTLRREWRQRLLGRLGFPGPC